MPAGGVIEVNEQNDYVVLPCKACADAIIVFAKNADRNAEQKLLDAIMDAYTARAMERGYL